MTRNVKRPTHFVHSLKHAASLSIVLLMFALGVSYAQAPVPFINLPLVPDATPPGGPQFTLTVNGTGFVSGSVVQWNGNALATQFVSSSQLTARVPASDIATAGTGWVTVVNPASGGGTSNLTFFGVTGNNGNSVSFNLASSPAVGKSPSWVAVGDFNGDGILDLAVTNYSSNTLSILLGDGKGNFTLASSPATGVNPASVAVGDFNGDGKLDLAVANYFNGGVLTVLLGDGTGNFALASSPQSNARYPQTVVVGDFNGDGKLDLATADMYDFTVSILLGDGTGNFSPGVTFGGGSSPYDLAVGDFNQDGNLDLAVGNFGANDFLALMGDGKGNFNSSTSLGVGCEPLVVTAGDFNGDGKLDVVAGDDVCSLATPLLGDGMGNFTALPSLTFADTIPFAIAAGDFNGDNKLDVAIANWRGSISVLLGDGTGNFTVATSPTIGLDPEGIALGDFNGDGLLDIAVPTPGNGTVSILLQAPPVPSVSLSTTSLNFGTQLLNTSSASQAITMTNTGTGTLTITKIAGGVNFPQTNNCGSSLAAGASCTITVTFVPKGTGTLTGAITITDNAANSPQTVALTGVGTAVTVAPSSLSFGGQTVGKTSSPQPVTVTNHAKTALRITGIHIAGSGSASFVQTNNCGTSVAAGGTCTINVTFTPKSKGAKTAMATVGDNGGASPQAVALSGTGK